FDNSHANTIRKSGDMWEFYFKVKYYAPIKIVAATCAIAGADLCPCGPLNQLTDAKYKLYAATPERVGPCNSTRSTIKFDVTKAENTPEYKKYGYGEWMSAADTAKSFITCRAGLWMLWKLSSFTNWAV
ncbi:hypothetical protein PMAYCL1PPCAC_22569, partial [Pristionchus mayeri]